MTSHNKPIQRLSNMQDIGPLEIAKRDSVTSILRAVFDIRGYERTETPILEQTELYLRKSGGALASRLYDFLEPGGFAVSLRPEFTSAILRYVAESTDLNGTFRLMYDGPVFRYAGPEDEDGDKTRQFAQLGAEMIGTPHPSADGEIIAMSLEGLDALGINSPKVVVGHVGVVLAALGEFNLSERAKLFLVNSIGELKKGHLDLITERAAELGFAADIAIDDAQLVAERSRLALKIQLVTEGNPSAPSDDKTGLRTASDIISRLSRKMSQTDNPENFKQALKMLSRLTQVNGPAKEAVADAVEVFSSNGIKNNSVCDLTEVLNAAEVEGVARDKIEVDFGLVRGIAYYTGVLFDIYAGDNNDTAMGGGGRYDGLTRALGYERDVPALGFAYNLDAVIAAAPNDMESVDEPLTISPVESGSVKSAVTKARRLRATGQRAFVTFENPEDSAFDGNITRGRET
jgi:histidyl-tRNA synthetase